MITIAHTCGAKYDLFVKPRIVVDYTWRHVIMVIARLWHPPSRYRLAADVQRHLGSE